jgi:hypothetical protein
VSASKMKGLPPLLNLLQSSSLILRNVSMCSPWRKSQAITHILQEMMRLMHSVHWSNHYLYLYNEKEWLTLALKLKYSWLNLFFAHPPTLWQAPITMDAAFNTNCWLLSQQTTLRWPKTLMPLV